MSNNLPMPEVGTTAPRIDAITSKGERFAFDQHPDSWFVVFFYPMANTPG